MSILSFPQLFCASPFILQFLKVKLHLNGKTVT
jgi:hypothetical protein